MGTMNCKHLPDKFIVGIGGYLGDNFSVRLEENKYYGGIKMTKSTGIISSCGRIIKKKAYID